MKRYEAVIFMGAGTGVISMACGYPGWAMAGGAISLLAALLRPPRRWPQEPSNSKEIIERVLARQAIEGKGKKEISSANEELEG